MVIFASQISEMFKILSTKNMLVNRNGLVFGPNETDILTCDKLG